MKNKITIIVPVYKIQETFLRECIESLLEQGRDDYKVILVDDGSPDSCGLICDEYAGKSDILEVIHQENLGVSAARNAAIKRVETEWLTFVDSDDWVEKDYVDTIYRHLTGDARQADIIAFDYIKEYRASSEIESLNVPEGYFDEEMSNEYLKGVFFRLDRTVFPNRYEPAVLWDKVYKTEFLRGNNIHFDLAAKKGQDRLLNSEAVSKAERIYYIPLSLYHYRCFEASRTNRYDPKVPDLVTIELSGMQKVIEEKHLENVVSDAFDCYVSTRIYSCMRLAYFHRNNKAPYRERVQELKKLVEKPLFKNSLENVRFDLLSIDEKIFVHCIKWKMYGLCSLLVKAKSGNFRRKLA